MPRYVDIECDAVTEVIGRRAFKSREDIQDFLDNIPTADVQEVKHGYWYNVYMSSPSSFVGTCSECQRTNDIPPPEQAHYCTSCGAKMDGGDAE